MDKIKIIKKNDEYSSEYQIGDTFEIEGTWYGVLYTVIEQLKLNGTLPKNIVPTN